MRSVACVMLQTCVLPCNGYDCLNVLMQRSTSVIPIIHGMTVSRFVSTNWRKASSAHARMDIDWQRTTETAQVRMFASTTNASTYVRVLTCCVNFRKTDYRRFDHIN